LIAWRSSGAAQPIATVQGQDTHADCTQLRAEIEANNVKLKQLSVVSQLANRVQLTSDGHISRGR
jgi:hypothetical protein